MTWKELPTEKEPTLLKRIWRKIVGVWDFLTTLAELVLGR